MFYYSKTIFIFSKSNLLLFKERLVILPLIAINLSSISFIVIMIVIGYPR